MKRPSFQFYPGDWRRDSALQSCSLVARGMWIEIMCVMHECIPYGKLSVNGQPMTIEQLARIVGESATVTRRIMDELEHAGVFSRDDQGIVFSRRMVKDGHISDVRSAAGKLGGNPDLLKQNDKQNASKTQANAEQSPTPSSSSSSSSNQEQPAPSKKRSGASSPVALDTWVQSLAGGEAIKADDPIFDYADKANLPFDFIELAWKRFCEDMRTRGIRKKDWRAHFRNAVKGNWHRLWYADGDGWKLTTAGEQARRTLA